MSPGNSTDLFYCCMSSGNVCVAVVHNLGVNEDRFSRHEASLAESQSCGDSA